jgi:uncharacterized phiE125 gp8 family phage protein
VAASTDLTTRDDLKRYLGIDAGDTSQDDLLDDLIDYASERIETHCRRRFASEELTEYLDGPGTTELVLSRRPVSVLSSVRVDADRGFAAETEVDSSELVLRADAGVAERVGAIFPAGARNVRVEYTAGYSTVPDDLALACVKLAAAWYAHARAGADGVTREALGDHSATFSASALPADVEAMLEPYRERAAS